MLDTASNQSKIMPGTEYSIEMTPNEELIKFKDCYQYFFPVESNLSMVQLGHFLTASLSLYLCEHRLWSLATLLTKMRNWLRFTAVFE